MYHRYLQNESGKFQKQRIKTPAPQTEKKPPALPKSDFSFLKKILPNMDSGDILVLLILLLLLAEGNEDSDSIVMTLAIFLFLQ